jgi:hypothetical protein
MCIGCTDDDDDDDDKNGSEDGEIMGVGCGPGGPEYEVEGVVVVVVGFVVVGPENEDAECGVEDRTALLLLVDGDGGTNEDPCWEDLRRGMAIPPRVVELLRRLWPVRPPSSQQPPCPAATRSSH